MAYLRALAVLVGLWSFGPVGCAPSVSKVDDAGITPDVVEVSHEPAMSKIDWTAASDCLGKLGLLQQGLNAGGVETLDATPFALISDRALFGRAGPGQLGLQKQVSVSPVSLDTSAGHAKRCTIRLGRVREQKGEHRLIGRERVRSSYQSGSRMEKNPAYEAAQVRLRQAERANKPGKSSIITVGDPLLDLIGLVVGGAITGITKWGEGDQVEEAIENLMATPRSIEQPTYRPYQFERTRYRASREAILPVIMTDRQLQKSWRVAIKRREVKELSVLDGLDRQDRDYAEHRDNGMTDQEFRQWQAAPPELPVEDMVAGLLGASQTTSVDRIASLDPANDKQAVFSEGDVADAAVRPPAVAWRSKVEMQPGRTVSGMAGRAPTERVSVVDVVGRNARGKGVYIAPAYILAGSELVEGQGLVDIGDGSNRTVLGLVAAVDRSRGLALVQVPRPGSPAILNASRSGLTGGSDSPSRHRQDGSAKGSGPILDGRRLLGFRSNLGPDIPIGEIRAFLGEQDASLLISHR